MRSRSIFVTTCFTILLALTQVHAQTQAQAVDTSATVERQAVSEGMPGSVPRLVRYSGVLNVPNPQVSGPVGVEFAVYTEESGGVAVWSEIQNVAVDASGHFTVLLGATKNGGLAPEVLGTGEPRWLSVTPLGGQALPRVRLVSVPYALRAEEALRINGVPASEFVRKTDLPDSVRETIRSMPPETKSNQATSDASGPTAFSGSTTTQIVSVQQTGTGKAIVASATSGTGITAAGGSGGIIATATASSAIGIQGTGPKAGVVGTGTASTGIGVQGLATSTAGGANIGVSGIASSIKGTGVAGQGSAFGVSGTAANAGGVGVKGVATDITDITGADFGVQGIGHDATGAGVNGTNMAVTGSAFGVTGNSGSSAGIGVQGSATSLLGNTIGVQGLSASPTGSGVVGSNTYSNPTSGVGVLGSCPNANGNCDGVMGNTNSTGNGSAGVNGYENAGSGPVYGVSGDTNSTGPYAAGVVGNEGATSGLVYGVSGYTASTGSGSTGVNGNEAATSGVVYGVNGYSQSPNGIGVNGSNGAASGPTIGVQGSSASPQGYGLSGTSPNVAVAGFNQNCDSLGCTLGTGIGGQFYTGVGGTLLQGLSGTSFSSLTPVFTVDSTGKGFFNGGVSSTINNPNGNAIVATNNATSGSAAALVGISYSSSAAGIAGYDYSTLGGGGLYGESHSASAAAIDGANFGGGLAGSFFGGVSITGNLNVSGTITGSTKDFRIDDPIDPAGKYLYHASIESNEMANLYSGNVILDRRGEAIVDLPEWFEALNGDFRYQLTAIGRAAPVYIAQEIENHRFKIAGGRAGMKVSWQVTGVRRDAWAQSHPLRVEEDKLKP